MTLKCVLPAANVTITAKINQLQIQGIRSFDSGKSSTIKFYTPLTLIVGYNGSGKTTIIECLKYATTGDQPPNSKGGAFIHDPKLCREKEVVAQVKLQFKSTNGATMVVTRSLQLALQKSGPPKQKTLEGNLAMHKNGERTTVSKRVLELDKLLPHYFGVSKAILESVIFCHQDESLWPMSEPAPLKKKFDEIFEAQKYTKAIDNIKQLRKNQGATLQILVRDEAACKENKVKADKMEKNLIKLQAEIEELREDIADSTKQAREANAEWQKSQTKVAQYNSVVESLKNSRKQKEWNEGMVRDLGRSLKTRHESDDWLQNELDRYDERIIVHEDQKKKQAKIYEKLQIRLKDATEVLRAKDLEQGKYEQQITNHKKLIEDRKRLILDSARTHNLRGYDYDLDDAKIQEFSTRISKTHRDQATAMDKARQETEDELQEVGDAISTLREQQSALGREKENAKQQLTTNERKSSSYQSQTVKINVDEASKALLESKIQDIDRSLTRAKDEWSSGSWDTKVQTANTRISAIEDESDRLDHEMKEANKKSTELARLDFLKKETEERQTRLDTMSGAYGSRLRDLMGQNWSPAALETDYQAIVRTRTQQVKDAEARRNDVMSRLQHVDIRLGTLRSDLKKSEKELESCAVHIRESLVIDNSGVDPENYRQGLERLQEERDIVKSDLDSFAFENDYFSKCLKTLDKKHICKTCERPFQKPEEKARLVRKLNDALNRDKREVEDDYQRLENELQVAKAAALSHTMWERLSRTELPQSRSQIKELEISRGEILSEVEGHDKNVEDTCQSLKEAESVSQPVSKIVKELKESTSFRAQAEELAAKQKDAGLSRTSDDIQKELDSRRKSLRGLRLEVTKFTESREKARSHVSELELELSRAKNELTTTNHQLENKASIEQQIEDLYQQNRELRERMKRLDEQARSLAPRLAEEETRRDDIRLRGSDRQRELQRRLKQLSESIQKLDLAAQAIDSYVAEGGPAKLSRCQEEIKATQQDISQIEDEQKQVGKEINKINDELGNQESNKRSIEDNIKYRKSQRDLDEINKEIASLSAQNAEADLAEHTRKAEQWARQHDLHSSAKTEKLGTMRAKDAEAQRMISEYETDYKDAARRFKEVHIKVETTKAAMEDLKRYMEALDKAITRYHSLKMEEINRIIEELWRRTYQGTDIDSISIRADKEGLKGNRTTNYRVCMVKQDTEMDMRGRCSAGQKVLASIIIRLALAECFGVNCGLIALDEPTTNLDRDNIRSLAESLHDIIRMRQQQANFQLIVITHDEEFLRFMKCADFCDYYFRVSRDGREKSKIERQSIAEVL